MLYAPHTWIQDFTLVESNIASWIEIEIEINVKFMLLYARDHFCSWPDGELRRGLPIISASSQELRGSAAWGSADTLVAPRYHLDRESPLA